MERQQRQAARRLARLAGRLHTAYERRRATLGAAPLVATLERFAELARTLDAERRRLAITAARGWHAGTDRVANRVRWPLDQLPPMTDALRRDCRRAIVPRPTFRDLYDELAAIETEWGAVVFHPEPAGLCVETDPITLEDIDLGPFRIILDFARLATHDAVDAFWVEALEPNPAAINRAVTHPHVSDDRLCCGEAGHPIRAALESGRIGEFLALVRAVLTTYNPHSPYVALRDWDGEPCTSCGFVACEDDQWTGTHCDCVLCGECVRTSIFDDAVGCRACMVRSDVSGEWLHGEDAEHCDACGRTAHGSELEGGLCEDCQERNCDEESEDESEIEADSSSDVESQGIAGTETRPVPREGDGPGEHPGEPATGPGAGVHAVGVAEAPVSLPPR